jgi:hypothetical protein
MKNFPDTDLNDFHYETFLCNIPLVGVTSSGKNQKNPSEFPMSKNPWIEKISRFGKIFENSIFSS